MSKNCPFCKKEITLDTEKCPHCNMVLFEKLTDSQSNNMDNHNIHQRRPSETAKLSLGRKIKDYLNRLKLRRIKVFDHKKINAYKKIGIVAVICLFIYLLFSNNDNSTQDTQINYSNQTPTMQHENDSLTLPKPSITSLKNGEVLMKRIAYFNGYGELNIDNGTDKDAVAKLVNIYSDKSVINVYIKAKSTYTITNISDGNYKLVFSLGRNWESSNNKFLQYASYEVFEENFDFSTSIYNKNGYEETQYTTFKVTLNPVFDGNAETENVDPDKFISY